MQAGVFAVQREEPFQAGLISGVSSFTEEHFSGKFGGAGSNTGIRIQSLICHSKRPCKAQKYIRCSPTEQLISPRQQGDLLDVVAAVDRVVYLLPAVRQL